MWRVTLTKHVLREAKLRMVLAAGANKRPVLQQVRDGADFPIALVTRGEIETWWLIDRAAAPD
jgi:gluconokinase/6-phosphogluconolactonase